MRGRIGCLETSETINLRHVTTQKSENLIFIYLFIYLFIYNIFGEFFNISEVLILNLLVIFKLEIIWQEEAGLNFR